MTKDRSEYPEDAQQDLSFVWFEIEIIEPRVADQRLKVNFKDVEGSASQNRNWDDTTSFSSSAC